MSTQPDEDDYGIPDLTGVEVDEDAEPLDAGPDEHDAEPAEAS